MDLIYPSSAPSLNGKRSIWKSYSIPLTLVALATTLSFVSIFLSVTVWQRSKSLVDEVRRVEGQAPRTTGSSEVCLPCDTILDASSSTEERMMSKLFFNDHRFDPSNTKEDTGDWSGKKDMCCAKESLHLRWLLEMFLKIRSRKERDQGKRKRRRCLVFPSVESSVNGTHCIVKRREDSAAAQLTEAVIRSGSGSTPSHSSGGFAGILDWTKPSVLHGRVVNSYGRLNIRSTGVYFVHSQIYFVEYEDYETTNNDGANSSDTVSVYIKRFVNQTRQNEVLTEGAERRCSRSALTSASLCEYTVYAGSLVELAADDSVYVTVSHPSMVNNDAKITYFGLQKVT